MLIGFSKLWQCAIVRRCTHSEIKIKATDTVLPKQTTTTTRLQHTFERMHRSTDAAPSLPTYKGHSGHLRQRVSQRYLLSSPGSVSSFGAELSSNLCALAWLLPLLILCSSPSRPHPTTEVVTAGPLFGPQNRNLPSKP